MGLLDQPTLSTATQQQVAAQTIARNLRAMVAQIVRGYTPVYQQIWKHPTLTPQQVCDALGTNAGQLFALAAQLKTLVNSAKPGAITLTEPNQITTNADGTVKIGVPVVPGSQAE